MFIFLGSLLYTYDMVHGCYPEPYSQCTTTECLMSSKAGRRWMPATVAQTLLILWGNRFHIITHLKDILLCWMSSTFFVRLFSTMTQRPPVNVFAGLNSTWKPTSKKIGYGDTLTDSGYPALSLSKEMSRKMWSYSKYFMQLTNAWMWLVIIAKNVTLLYKMLGKTKRDVINWDLNE